MNNNKKQNTGAALIMVLILISLLLMIGSSFLNCTVKDFIISENLVNNTQAHYNAESGIQLAYAVLSLQEPLENHEVVYITRIGAESWMEVWVEQLSEEDRLVISIGCYENAREKIKAIMTKEDTDSGLYIRKWMKPNAPI